MSAQLRGQASSVSGKVISDKMDKTISVLVYNTVKHKKYGKYIQKKTVLKAHDEKNQAQVGDMVCIYQTRPLSKTKRWRLVEIFSDKNSDKGQ